MLELAVLLLVLLLALSPLLARMRRKVPRAYLAPLCALAALAILARAAAWYAYGYKSQVELTDVVQQTPAPTAQDGYLGAAACKACHPREFQSWHGSFHRTMTQLATPAAVKASFDNVRLSSDRETILLARRGDSFFARVAPTPTPPDAPLPPDAQEFQIVMTTGSHHYQIYWYRDSETRGLRPFPYVWLLADRRWVPREAALITPPGARQSDMHWNENCIRCHSTHSRPRGDERTGRFDTTTVELGISCEACHGPGEKHVQRHQSALGRYLAPKDQKPDPTTVNPHRLPAERVNQLCGQCHAMATFPRHDWWHGHWNDYAPGDDLHREFTILRRNDPETHGQLRQHLQTSLQMDEFFSGRFWTDGVPRVAGREYNSLLETRCYTAKKELSCLNCHSMHHFQDPSPGAHGAADQLLPGMEGNAACTQCHREDRFTTRLTEHTHHRPASSGSLCYNCHMPHTTYGLLKAIRSHAIVSPSVAASLQTGRPHACNQCHLDESLGWTQETLHAWFGTPKVQLPADDAEISATVLQALRGDAAQRALAAWAMGWSEAQHVSGREWLVPYLARLLDDPYAAVRYAARRSLRRIEGYESVDFDYLAPPDVLAGAAKDALNIFQQRSEKLDRRGPAVLFSPEGKLDTPRFQALFQQRDDRPVDINE